MPTPPQFFDMPFWQGLLSNGVATLIGAFVGVFLAIWAENKREGKNLKEEKRKVLFVLLNELNINYCLLSQWIEKGRPADDIDFLGYDVNVEAWRAFSDGGELECIKQPSILHSIAVAYFHLETIKSISIGSQQARLMGLIRSTSVFHERSEKQLSRAVDNYFEAIKVLDKLDLYVYPQPGFGYTDDHPWWKF